MGIIIFCTHVRCEISTANKNCCGNETENIVYYMDQKTSHLLIGFTHKLKSAEGKRYKWCSLSSVYLKL